MLMAGTAAFILLFDNATLWSKGSDIFSGHMAQLYVLIVAMFFLLIAFFSVFGNRRTLQPFLAFMLILSSVTSYYMDNLGVIIDRDMIQNVVTTTVTEAKHLLTISFAYHVFIWGMVPAFIVSYFTVQRRSFIRALSVNIGLCFLCLAITVGLIFTDFKIYSSVFREHKDFLGSQQPGAALVGTVRYVKMISRTKNIVVKSIGIDAQKGENLLSAKKPVLSIIIIGETARSQNFSLNGYKRKTNPALAKRSVISFTDVNSCGTATAVSLPCMFSKFDRKSYSYNNGLANENLLDVLQHAGMNVEWWDNNTGHKHIGDRIKTHKITHENNAEFCASGECNDGIFYHHIEDAINNITQDTVLVLHQIGSHGPTYYLRYPDELEIFQPACRTTEFKNCTPEEITNAYDNTIAFTDYNVAMTIDLLARQDQLLTSLVYVSDHGESLGEAGLYLHGAPYFIAPKTQTKVPLIVWMSPDYKKQFQIDQACLEANARNTIGHANFFHSILGLLNIETSERHEELDIFAKCKT
jgi:lipid A ethanolaminephosphotransferase